jgi:hypothetical protein
VRGLGSSLSRAVQITAYENDDREWEAKCEEAEWRRNEGCEIDSAMPGSNSALRAPRGVIRKHPVYG